MGFFLLVFTTLRSYIEPEELKEFLEQNGGENVVILNLKKPLVDISTFVIASFPSTRLIRKAAEAIKENVNIFVLYHLSISF